MSSCTRRARLVLRPTGVVLVLGLLVTASVADAQVLYGSIVGNVKDTTGAAVPGAIVVITHGETKATRETPSDGAGAYRFPTVQTGTYSVVVQLPGFQTFTRSGVEVTLNTIARVDALLAPAQLQEMVTVAAETPLLQTERAEVRHEIRSRELRDLPVPIGRNYQELFKTIPGFTPEDSEPHSIPSNPSRALQFNVNGASSSTNNTRIDGVSSTNIWLPHVTAYVPALESIETVNVVTNNFDAEQGLAGGAAISVQIKSGTNTLRGSMFEYHQNEALRTRNYFTPADRPKGKYRHNQFGGTLGGPIKRDKLFYFASYEGSRLDENRSSTRSVPTLEVRNGDFSRTGATIYDPSTGNADGSGRTPFPNNAIPQGRWSSVYQAILPHIPPPNLPNADGTMPEFNNYFLQAPFAFNRWTLDTKVNYNASNRLQIFGRYSQLGFWQDNKPIFGDFLQGNPSAGGNPGIGWGGTYNFSTGANYTFGNNLVLDAHFGWVRMDSNVEMHDIKENKGLDLLRIPGTNGPDPWDGGMPWFDFDGYHDFGTTEDFMPYYRADDQYQWVANMSWLKGRHNVRFGSDIYYQALSHIQPEIPDDSFGSRGGFEFNSGPTNLRGQSGNNFQSWASFVLGLPSEVGRLKLIEAPYKTRLWMYSFYVRDQWQINDKVTLSFGTRWEYFPVPTRGNRGLERYNLATNMMEIGGVGSVPKDLGVEVSKTMFAPRLGATYRISDRMVLRGGFGITNDPYSLAREMRTNHPVLLNLLEEAPNSFAWVRPIEQGISLIGDADLGNGIIPIPRNVTAVTIGDRFQRGRVESWNVAFEKMLKGAWVGEIAYVGTRQVNQLGRLEQNWAPIGGGSAGRQLVQRFGRTAPTILITPIGDSHYNSMQARLTRRFRDGYQLGVNYTLQRSIGIAGASRGSDGQPRIRIPELLHLNRGLSDQDRTHNLHIRAMVELPFGRGRRWLNDRAAMSAILGGWQLNAVLSFYSGTPFTVTTNTGPLDAAGSINQNPADRVVEDVSILGGVGRGNSYFDPLAFRPVTEARLGNSGFNSLRGPGVRQIDLNLFRQIDFGNTNLQLRLDAFNLENRPHFNNPGANVNNLRLNPDGTVRDLNGFTEITGTRGQKSERQLRLGIRLGF